MNCPETQNPCKKCLIMYHAWPPLNPDSNTPNFTGQIGNLSGWNHSYISWMIPQLSFGARESTQDEKSAWTAEGGIWSPLWRIMPQDVSFCSSSSDTQYTTWICFIVIFATNKVKESHPEVIPARYTISSTPIFTCLNKKALRVASTIPRKREFFHFLCIGGHIWVMLNKVTKWWWLFIAYLSCNRQEFNSLNYADIFRQRHFQSSL